MLEIPYSQIPEPFIARIAETINNYSVPLIKVVADSEGQNKDRQIGSGTLVSVGNTYGILTAQHVSRELVGRCKLGLPILKDENRLEIEKDHLNIIEIPSAEMPSEGPDLSFVALAAPDIATIKAVKSFLNLSFDKNEMLNDPPTINSGNWVISGTPGELTKQEASEKGFKGLMLFPSMCYFVNESTEYTKSDYDYIEVNVDYRASNDIPSTFGGMSGGGLWQVFIRKSGGGVFERSKFLLSGVIFYQSEVDKQYRFIRCHGRRSIYEHVFAKVESGK